MPLKLPSRADTSRLRALAKILVADLRKADEGSLRRVRQWFPEVTPHAATLSQAQTALAREYGFSSWTSMITEVERRAEKRKERIARKERELGDTAALAEFWFSLAEAGDLDRLWQSFGVAASRIESARELMLKSPERHDRFLVVLVDGLSHAKPRARFEFAHLLDTFGDARCIEPLKKLMDDAVPRVRWMAMHALTCHACNPETCPHDPALVARIAHHARADESMAVRRHATIALGLSRNRAIEPVVRDILATVTDKRHRRAAQFALHELSRPGSAEHLYEDAPGSRPSSDQGGGGSDSDEGFGDLGELLVVADEALVLKIQG